MKNIKKNLVLIAILLVVTLTALTACNLDVLKIDIEDCQITFSENYYVFTGQEITPKVTVKYGERVLQKDVDYTVEYANNVNVGKGYVKVTGIGNFKGEAVKSFDIIERSGGKDYLLYSFYAPDAEVVSGKLSQIVESVDQIIVPEVRKRGYIFLYWTLDGERVDFEDRQSIPIKSSQFEAKFELITYTVKYVLNGGVNSDGNKKEYTVEDVFELQDATRVDKKFVGWYLDSNFDEQLSSLSGITSDLVLYAKYVDFDYKKTLSYGLLPDGVNADNYQEQTLYPGTELTRPAEVLSQDKSKKLVWYIDEAMTVRHNLRYMPDGDLTLYARWEDNVYAGFLDRDWYDIRDINSIDSYADMLAYVEFVLFYNITNKTTKRVTYVSGQQNIETEIAKALAESTFPRMLGVSYKAVDSKSFYIYMSESTKDQATLSATDAKDYFPQIGNVFNNYKSNRSSIFDAFAINHVENVYEGCSTTDQLFYILSHGYRPIIMSDTPASRAYEQFKVILRSICDDRMSDLQKARAIYDWLILNVYYDNNVANGNVSNSNYKYDAFYIEGVLKGAAVCDGLSKAYAAMCAIEGIDCVRVTGKKKNAVANEAGHAWNKIQLMGEWYLTDATWGNRVVRVNNSGYYEYVSEEYFLFTDEHRATVDNYNSDQYAQYVAHTQFNYFSRFKMQLEYTTGNILTGISKYTRTFDLCLDGDANQNMTAVEELSYIFEYIDKSGVPLDGTSFCIMLGEEMSLDILNEALNIYTKRVGISKARIKSYGGAFGNVDDVVDDKSGTYKKGSIITVVFSLPTSNAA